MQMRDIRPEKPAPAAPEAGPAPRRPGGGLLRRALLSEYFVLWLTLVYFAALLPFLPALSNPANLANVLSNVWPLFAVAVGQTLVLTIAGIDLSQGAVVGLSGVILAMLVATAGAPETLSRAPIWEVVIGPDGGLLAGLPLATVLGVAVMLAFGAAAGALNGFAVAVLRMPAFMVTLVALMVLSALALWLTQSENIRDLPAAVVALGKGSVVSLYFGAAEEPKIARRALFPFVTYPMVIAVLLGLAVHFLMSRTVFGRYVYAIGMNRRAAEISGTPVVATILLVFTLSGFCAAVGGLLYAARIEAGMPNLGSGTFLLDIIGATVIGGTSLFGGKGKILWTFFGVLFFALLSNTLNLMNLSTFHIDMVKGGVILAAAMIDAARQRLLAAGG